MAKIVGDIVLTDAALSAVREHAERAYPEEACGGLLGRAEADGPVAVVRAISAANARDGDRERRYLIGPESVLEMERLAREADLQLVGYYHSHPDAVPEPSEFDRTHAWPWYAYVIVAVQRGRASDVTAWRLSDDRAKFKRLTLGR